MKVTKFAQSCILIETNSAKILVDPGHLLLDENVVKAWMHPDFILITHKHGDHFHEESVKRITTPKTIIFATRETADFYKNTKFKIIKQGNKFSLGSAGIEVEVVKGVHGYLPRLKGAKEVNEAIGYIFTEKNPGAQNKRLYHTGDTISFKNDYKCDTIMLPVNNHGVCLGPYDAAAFAKETGAGLVIPIHYDNPELPADMEKVEEEFKKAGLNYKILKMGESIEL